MATIGTKFFELTQMSERDLGLVFSYEEEASQTFLKKAPVILDNTSGEVEVAPDTTQILGMSLEAASTTTGTLILVQLVTYDQIWSGNSSTTGAGIVTALTDLGDLRDYLASTATGETAKTVLDTDSTNMFEILALDPRDVVGDTNGRLLFRIEQGKIGVNAT